MTEVEFPKVIFAVWYHGFWVYFESIKEAEEYLIDQRNFGHDVPDTISVAEYGIGRTGTFQVRAEVSFFEKDEP